MFKLHQALIALFMLLAIACIAVPSLPADGMETVIEGPRTTAPAQDERQTPPADGTAVGASDVGVRRTGEKSRSWWSRFTGAVSGFFTGLFGAGDASGSKGRVIATTGLVMRDGPGLGGGKVGSLPAGSEVSILDVEDGWYKIDFQEDEAWVSGRYVLREDMGEAGQGPDDEVVIEMLTEDCKPGYVNVPRRTQYDSANGKYQGSWCGPTALGMVYEHYGIKQTTREIAQRIYDFEGRMGTFATEIVKDAKAQGFENTGVQTGADFEYLESELRAGNPVIVSVEVAWKSGHYMVVVGLEGDKVIVNDPGRSTVRRKFSRFWFLTQWNGRWRRTITLKK